MYKITEHNRIDTVFRPGSGLDFTVPIIGIPLYRMLKTIYYRNKIIYYLLIHTVRLAFAGR